MKSKILTSILVGLVLPLSYFLFVTVSTLDVYEDGKLVNEGSGKIGVSAFIEFNGILGSLIIYCQAAFFCFIVSFVICSINNYLDSWFSKKL